jgi:hypothetical protein
MRRAPTRYTSEEPNLSDTPAGRALMRQYRARLDWQGADRETLREELEREDRRLQAQNAMWADRSSRQPSGSLSHVDRRFSPPSLRGGPPLASAPRFREQEVVEVGGDDSDEGEEEQSVEEEETPRTTRSSKAAGKRRAP